MDEKVKVIKRKRVAEKKRGRWRERLEEVNVVELGDDYKRKGKEGMRIQGIWCEGGGGEEKVEEKKQKELGEEVKVKGVKFEEMVWRRGRRRRMKNGWRRW